MGYDSVDKLQRVLAEDVFHYTHSSKKAAGRALGTLVEIITFYLLKSWDLHHSISIEKGLVEYGNPDITHNVEYSLHPILNQWLIPIEKLSFPVSSNQIVKLLMSSGVEINNFEKKSTQLLDKNGILRNACTVANSATKSLVCSLDRESDDSYSIRVIEQHKKPFAIFECKRVGVEEGQPKGPQTIEKAKQGAYVARTASSLQKIRTERGEAFGIIYKSDNTYQVGPYTELMETVIGSREPELLRRFILTVGVVSNHGNWFTSDNQNKELKVLAQSYDWLLFLTDQGLTEFIEVLILKPQKENEPVREAFIKSYSMEKTKNQFTKVQMKLEADQVLQRFFKRHVREIEGWFNVISPRGKDLDTLKFELNELKNKNWQTILL